MPVTVDLRVPITDAIEWEPWLTEALSYGAEEFKVGYDGGEEEGRYESHMFLDADVETVKTIAEKVLHAKGFSRQVTITGDGQVTVAGCAGDWIVPVRVTDSTLKKKLKMSCRQLNDDKALATWFRAGGDHRFLFTVHPIDGWNFRRPRGGEAREGDVYVMAPTDDVREILTHLAAFLGRPLPELTIS